MADVPTSPEDKSVKKANHSDLEKSAASELIEATNQGVIAAEEARKSAETLSTKSSSVLAGTLGTAVGTGLAYGVSIKIASVSFFIAGPIGFVGGLAGGMLLFRGPKSMKKDREIEDKRREAKSILDDINQLPADAPQELRDKLWKEYERARLGHRTIDISPNN